MLTVDELPADTTGRSCGCLCPDERCRGRLIARRPLPGSDYTANFAHDPETPCKSTPETILHETAKYLVAHSARLALPAIGTKSDRVVTFNHGRTEVPFLDGAIRADAVLTKINEDGTTADLIVEIVVAHDLTPEKIALLAHNQLRTVRVDLSAFPRDFKAAELEAALFQPGTSLITWVYPKPPSIAPPRSTEGDPRDPAGSAIFPTRIRLGMTMELPVQWKRLGHGRPTEPGVFECPLAPRSWKAFFWANATLDCTTCPGRNTDFRHTAPYYRVFCRAAGYEAPPGPPKRSPRA
jgi:hypothetical protein